MKLTVQDLGYTLIDMAHNNFIIDSFVIYDNENKQRAESKTIKFNLKSPDTNDKNPYALNITLED